MIRRKRRIAPPPKVSTLFPIAEDSWINVVKRLGLPVEQAKLGQLLLHGLQDKEIAGRLGIKPSTVRTQLSRLFERTDARDRVHFILYIIAVANQSAPQPVIKSDESKFDVNANDSIAR